MGLLAWVIFGALAGWVASIITGRNERQGCIMNIVVGIVGALLGGFLIQLLTGVGVDIGFNLRSFLVAVLGAVVLLLIVGMVRR
jgi:uncharacterized membrane protein YeaQ/YmgE (transglycosylase-associated protein family)